MQKFIWYILLTPLMLLCIGCNGIEPKIMKNNISIIHASSGTHKKKPFVVFFQGTGGTNHRARKWAQWFKRYGVSSVIIDNAGARNLHNLKHINDTHLDLSPTLKVIQNDSKLDLNHYAVMGFSRGGTASLKSASSLNGGQAKPDFVFALYPGIPKGCPNSHSAGTEVHIFYGDKDEWGAYKNVRKKCIAMAKSYRNTTFHLLKNAHHGYDGNWNGKWNCCNKSFLSKPNQVSLSETKRIILGAMQRKWFTKK